MVESVTVIKKHSGPYFTIIILLCFCVGFVEFADKEDIS